MSINENASMDDRLFIEGLEFQGRCGATEGERQSPQPIGVDVDLVYPHAMIAAAAETDDLAHAVDYAKVAERVIQVGTGQEFRLLETLAERLSSVLLAEFRVSRVQLWVRKLAPPVKGVTGSVGIRVDRARSLPRSAEPLAGPLPSSFLVQHLPHLPKGTALDVATGGGRNALYLAAHGYSVEGIDRDEQALAEIAATAKQRNLPNLTVRCMDLEANPDRAPDFPKERYDVILVFFYLYRPLFPALIQALRPGGALVYETFLIDNYLRDQHPRRKEFCLAHNELLRLTTGLRVLHYDEGEHGTEGHDRPVTGTAFTARLLAVKER